MKRYLKIVSLICIVSLSILNCPVISKADNSDISKAIDIKAKSAILIEASTGKVLYEKNSHEKLRPASVTKVMTMLLVMEAIDNGRISLDNVVTTSEYASGMGGSQVYLAAGEQMTVHEMLKAIAVASGNDASVAMAEHVYGSEQAFVKAMNEKAKELGMNDTNFVNCNGLDADEHYTSAYDVALMSRELLKHPKITDYLTIWIDSLRNGEFGLNNTNKLIRFYKGANGIKTGSTSKALFCLSASAKRDDMQLISVVMAAPTSKIRFNNASKLLDYGFANYSVSSPIDKNEIVGEVEVVKGIEPKVNVVTTSPLNILVEKSQKDNIEQEINIADNILAPVESGQKVGEMTFYVDGEVIGNVDLVTAKKVGKLTIGEIFKRLIYRWFGMK